jgi:hypothetical protein
MSVDAIERFAVLQQAGKRLRQAIAEERWRDVEDEARFVKAICTQIECCAAGKVIKVTNFKGNGMGSKTGLVGMEEA